MCFHSHFIEQVIYKEPAVREPSISRLREIARGLGIDVEEAELQEYQSMKCNHFLYITNSTAFLPRLVITNGFTLF